ncbi:ABC transporter substrate-binding protein [Tardiphaga sp.]|uniref:ABC transporter substrate-binding protein n=1 Tax=Tardiphaga sp. TaxID=1926292 RepID=UPI002630090D|nr:ABC transporter substrate-binding protein [Tardiphaga sp.]
MAATLAPSALRAATTPDLSGVTLRVAYYKGLHKTLLETAGLATTPYKIDWKEFNSGVQHIEGINVDALDFGSGSETSAAFAAKSGARVKFIAVYREDLNNQGTFVQKDSQIRKITDLKGKRVGYVRGTTSHYYLYKQLAEAGLSFNDIQAVHLAPTDGLSAFSRGDLDAWAIWGYNGQLARTKFGAGTLKTAVGYLSGNFLISANPKAIDDPLRHAALADFLLRLKHAYAWSNTNYPTYAAAQSRDTAVPVDAILELFNNRNQDYSLISTSTEAIGSHQEVADVFTKTGVFDAPVDVKPYWDRSFDGGLA